MRCSQLRVVAPSLSLSSVAAGPTTSPSTRPVADWSTREYGFANGFRCSHYLHLAVQLQQLDPDRRAKRLREMAADDDTMSELFPLCRMLFDRKPGGEFRRPRIRGEWFVGSRDPFGRDDYRKWPLDPIALRDGIPILVVRGGGGGSGGPPEQPAAYVEHCLHQCEWRETKFADADPGQIRRVVGAFIAATPDLSDEDVTWLRRQAE